MISKFFLDRPVFAWVIAISLMAFGLLAIHFLPVSQYPELAPPQIAIRAFYPGASAESVESTVTSIIEQQMTGLDKLLYISSSSSSSGLCSIELTFAPGTDPDIAWAKVQNKLQLAMASLPEVVRREGVNVSKSTRNYMLAVGIVSENGRMNGNDLRDYMKSNIEKVLARVPGVGEVQSFGSEYSMRIWLNPDKLTKYNLTIEDVIRALRSYNVEVSAGQFGGAPAVKGQRMNASIIVQHFLKTPKEFASIPVKANQDGSIVRIRDVGRVELGTVRYDIVAKYNGKPAAILVVRKEPGANALDTARRIKKRMKDLEKFFPEGVKVVYPYDTTPFTVVATNEVIKTLIEAIFLVFLVMFLFLGNFRATLIPTIAVPVVVLGTFGVIWVLGFSINMLTMFAMVLAIGLLVDDAIVVVENVDRIMREEGLSPKEAAAKSMEQITSALIGIGLVLSSIFLPMAFFPGSTGIIYRQFSVTIASSMLLSVLVALVLTPVLCANLLKPLPEGKKLSEHTIFFLKPFFSWFDKWFNRIRNTYVKAVAHVIRRKFRYILLYFLLVGAMLFLFLHLPTSYLPDEDQGILYVQVVLPSGSTLEQTENVLKKVREYFEVREKDAVKSIATVAGFAFSGQGQNVGFGFVKLKDWKYRDKPYLKAKAVAGRAMMAFSRIKEARVFAFPPPAIIELGNSTGFDFELLDFGGLGHKKLIKMRNKLLYMAAHDPRVIRVRPNGMEDVPQYKIDVDWDKAGALGLPITSINETIATAFGSAYINNFIKGGRVKRVYVQADAPYRMLPGDLRKLYVRNIAGKMVPFSSFAKGHWIYGPAKLERYNGFPSVEIWGEPAPGYSTGDAMKAMEEFVSKLGKGVAYDWTALSYQERMATVQAPLVYGFSIFVIFLVLAALYESWPIPIANMLMLPLGVLGATVATWSRGLWNDVYFQIGFITTMGLSTKNAILIIQFIKERLKRGMGLLDATLEATRIRLRPVMMTSLAFFFGVLPLALNKGAGSGAMNAIGTAVCGGMISATFIDLFYIPLFFFIVYSIFKRKQLKGEGKSKEEKGV